MKIALFGTGRMGRTIVYMIKKLGDHTIHTWDSEERGVHGNYHTTCNMEDITSVDGHFDLAISALPYHLNLSIAKLCLKKKIPYCDLGGSVPVSDEINELAERSEATVFTDLGLAPGWANILAEEAFQRMPELPHAIKMRCGGLPVEVATSQTDPFNYKQTWSTEGLYNEYVDRSLLLENGDIISVPSLSRSEPVSIDGFPVLEAFTTSGGASHTLVSMQGRGVKNCSYKTLRYPGHLDLMVYFLHNRKFNATEMSNLFARGPSCDDMVVVEAEALCGDLSYRNTKVVYNKDGYTAMQRATAGGLVSAIFAARLDHGSPLTYADIDLDLFNYNMNKLDIVL